jgi:hypothetical protein
MNLTRLVSDELLNSLRHPLAPVLDLVRNQPAPGLFDLRLSTGDKALLYYAGYKALTIAHTRRGLAFVGGSHHVQSGFDPVWASPRPSSEWSGELPALLTYLRQLPEYVRSAVPSALNEGAVQGRLCATQHQSLTVIDRESAFSFAGSGGATGCEAVIAAVSLAIDDALASQLPDETWSHTRKAHQGGELDCLAVDEHGRLLAIEVKPATQMGTGAWAAAQALVYAQLFRLWLKRDGNVARRTLELMMEQRALLNLSQPRDLAREPPVVPVVAFGAPEPGEATRHDEAVRRAETVADALGRGNPAAPAVEWRRVELDGSLSAL